MARKKRTPEENARREKIRELLQMANIGSMADIQSLFGAEEKPDRHQSGHRGKDSVHVRQGHDHIGY